MDTELGPLRVRDVGIVKRPVVRPTVTRVAPTVARAPVRRRLEEPVRTDPLDSFITKMETFRPICPIAEVENTWKKITTFAMDITPPIPILPAESPVLLRTERGAGIRRGDVERAAAHFRVPISQVTPRMIASLPSRGAGLVTGRARR